MERNIAIDPLSESIKIEKNNGRISDGVAIEIIRSIKEITFKLLEFKYQSDIRNTKNI